MTEQEQHSYHTFPIEGSNRNLFAGRDVAERKEEEDLEIYIHSIPRNKRRRFLFLLLLSLFVAEASRGMVVATLYLYLVSLKGDVRFTGFVVGAFSLGRLIGGFLLGFHFNKRGAKEALLTAIGVSIIGNLLFSIGMNKYLVLISRFIVGFGTGILTITRAGISASTSKNERSRYFAWAGAVQFIGFALVAGLAEPLSYVNFKVGHLKVDEFTSGGYILTITNLLLFFLILFGFSNLPSQEQEESAPAGNEPGTRRRYLIGVTLFIFLNFVARGCIALMETIGAPLYLDVWDIEVNEQRHTARMFLILGIVGIVVYFLVSYLVKLIREKFLLCLSFILIGTGSVSLNSRFTEILKELFALLNTNHRSYLNLSLYREHFSYGVLGLQ